MTGHEQTDAAAVSAIAELLGIMDTLRSEGGCPWDAQQTHESLVEFLLEEAHETIAAIEAGDTTELVEELGDLLLQVVFHARLGEEEDPAWSITEVASGINAKLIRRHPHVFGDDADLPLDDAALAQRWAKGKAAEKSRTSALEGIPITLPALSQAQKTWRRAQEADLTLARPTVESGSASLTSQQLGDTLLSMAIEAEAAGIDAEAALRGAISDLRAAIVAAEQTPI